MDIATAPDAEFPPPKHENHHRLIRVDAFYSERTASSFLRLTQHELRELLRRKETPIRREERAVGAWLKAITASSDFDTGYRRDKVDG